jgi:hypothetical protein
MQLALDRQKKSKSIRTPAILGLVLICLMLAGSAAVPGQEHKEKLSKKELKALISTAKTPEDHLRVAAHYRAEDNEYLARQKEHLEDE